jgi:hypothetical protein
MTTPIQLNGGLYRLLLFAYPRDFRLRFGTEMVITFSEQIRAEREHAGLIGVMRVWRTAIREPFSVAVPLQLRSSIVLAMSVVPMVLCFIHDPTSCNDAGQL